MTRVMVQLEEESFSFMLLEDGQRSESISDLLAVPAPDIVSKDGKLLDGTQFAIALTSTVFNVIMERRSTNGKRNTSESESDSDVILRIMIMHNNWIDWQSAMVALFEIETTTNNPVLIEAVAFAGSYAPFSVYYHVPKKKNKPDLIYLVDIHGGEAVCNATMEEDSVAFASVPIATTGKAEGAQDSTDAAIATTGKAERAQDSTDAAIGAVVEAIATTGKVEGAQDFTDAAIGAVVEAVTQCLEKVRNSSEKYGFECEPSLVVLTNKGAFASQALTLIDQDVFVSHSTAFDALQCLLFGLTAGQSDESRSWLQRSEFITCTAAEGDKQQLLQRFFLMFGVQCDDNDN